MSVVAALQTTDGIVIGADRISITRLNESDTFTSNCTSKLFAYTKNIVIGATGSGAISDYKSNKRIALHDFINMLDKSYDVCELPFYIKQYMYEHDLYLKNDKSRWIIVGKDRNGDIHAMRFLPMTGRAHLLFTKTPYTCDGYYDIPFAVFDEIEKDLSLEDGIDIMKHTLGAMIALHKHKRQSSVGGTPDIYVIANDSKKSGWVQYNGHMPKK